LLDLRLLISDNKSLKLNKLKIFAKIKTERIAIPPPINAEKKLVKIWRQIFEIKWPKRLEGAIISEYLKEWDTKLIFKLGTAFFIFLKFSSVIVDIDKKKETITLLIFIIGVKIIKEMKRIVEPIM